MDGFGSIELGQKDAIEQIRVKYNHTLSSHHFVSLFIWKETMKLTVLVKEDLFVVRIGDANAQKYFFPVGKDAAKKTFLKEAFLEGDVSLYYMRPEDVAYMQEHFPEIFSCEEDLSAREYLYDKNAQILLEGHENKHIRHKIRQLKKGKTYYTEPLTEENIDRARAILFRWGTGHTEDDGHYADMNAAKLLLDHYAELHGNGCLVHDGETDCSVIIGSDLDETTHDMHLAKCAEPTIGLDHYTKIEYYRMLPERIKTINLEEDLGIAGLRIYKERLHPSGYNTIWRGTLCHAKDK